LTVEKDGMENKMEPREGDGSGLDRREFVAALRGALPGALFVAGLGSSAYDLFAAGDRDRNFYLWGAMGGAAAIGLGLAIARPGESVVVLTGDGEQLMGLGSLATIGAQQPPNLGIVVLDNGHFGETGMQPSHTRLGTDLVAVARGCGIGSAMKIQDRSGVDLIARAVINRSGPFLAQVLVRAEELPRALPPRDGAWLKDRFRGALGLKPF
jgi:thiamine pyrophosphate-dependent acetolactate synthase large subunit-like protein